MTSYSLRHNIQSRHIRKLGPGSTIRVDPLANTIVEQCVSNQLIRLRTLGEGEEIGRNPTLCRL